MFERQLNAWEDMAKLINEGQTGWDAKVHGDRRGMTVELVQLKGQELNTHLGDLFIGCLVSVDGEQRGKLSKGLSGCPVLKGAGLHGVEYRPKRLEGAVWTSLMWIVQAAKLMVESTHRKVNFSFTARRD